MQDDYERLADRFRRGEDLDRAELVRLCDLADKHRNYLLETRAQEALAAVSA